MNKSNLILMIVLVVILASLFIFQNFSAKNNIFGLNQAPSPNSSILTPRENKQSVEVAEQTAVEQVIQNSLPSVVTIAETQNISGGNGFINPFNPFSPFGQPSSPQSGNIGSGFVLSADGLIITNKHVVSDNGASYSVITNDNKSYNIQQIYKDPLNDISILKINASGLKPISLGDSANLKLGEMVIAIGTPLGQFQNTVTTGIISGLNRSITAGSLIGGSVEQLNNVIQTDAPISPGNSGGPLVDLNGNAIGINTAVASEGQNIGFAIPINTVKNVIENFQKNGSSFVQPYLGVRYQTIDQGTAQQNNIPQGAYVVAIVSGSPANKAGIQNGDIITGINNQSISEAPGHSLSDIVSQKKAGDKINLTLFRNNQSLTIPVTLAAAP